MFLPILLLLLICLQTFTSAQNAYIPSDQCCFMFQRIGISARFIEEYKITEPHCPKPAVIFFLKIRHHHSPYSRHPFRDQHRRRFCADPEDRRVQHLMIRVDKSRFELHAPQLCCFRLHAHPIPEHLIAGYKITDEMCESSGVIFILKDNRNYCVDPKENWVQNIMNKTEQTINRQQELVCHYGRGPGHWCFSFYDRWISLDLITGYEETAHPSPNHGVLFLLKDGSRVCTDPNAKWVKNHMDELDHWLFQSL